MIASGTTPTGDIKLMLLLQEAYRHCKGFAAWGDGITVLQDAGISPDSPGVSVGDSMNKAFTDGLFVTVGMHRVWERATAVMASAVPPAS